MQRRVEDTLLHLAQAMLRHPRRVLLITLILIGICASGLKGLAFSMDYRAFFDNDDAHVAAFDRLQRTYTKNDTILFVLVPKSGDVFSRQVLTTISDLTARGWKLPFAARVDSLTNFQHSRAEGDDLAVADLAGHPESMTGAELDAVRRIALGDELMVNRLVSPDGRATAVNVTVRLSAAELQSRGREVAAAARTLANAVRTQHPDLSVYLSGTLMVNDAFYEVAKRDLLTLIPAMFVVLVVSLALMLRSPVGSLATFAVVGASNAIALGIGAWIGIQLTPPSAAAAPIVMTLAIAGCVHLYTGYTAALLHGAASRTEAMFHSLKSNFSSMTLTTVTTFVGFWTMNFTPSPPFHDLGNLVLIGISAAFVLSVTAFPAIVLLLPGSRATTSAIHSFSIDRFIRFVVSRRTVLLWSGIALTAFTALTIPRNELDDEFLKYFDRSVPFRVDNDFITTHLTGVYQIEYSINAAGPEGVTDPRYLSTLDAFKRWFSKQPDVWHVDSITDVLKRLNKNLHRDDPAYERLPQTRDEAAQYLLLYGMSLPVGLDLNDRINVDKSATRFVVTLHTISANKMLALEERADGWLSANAPAYMRALGTGPAIIFAHIGASSITSGVYQELAAMGIISALMMLITRSLRIGSLTMVPNVVPAAMAFGIWGVIDGRVNMALSTVVGMTLGIVVDDTIHLLHRYLHARRHDQMTPTEAIHYALSEVGVAVAITSSVLIAGFLVLTLSPFVMNWGMGLLTAITLVFAMVVEFLMLPGLLLLADRDKPRDAVGLETRTAT
jgi:predicted RND superfamily exporter protein